MQVNKSNNKIEQKKQQKEHSKTEGEDPSYWQQMINGIVRPPRAKYNVNQLGNRVILLRDRMFVKEDYMVDHQGKLLQLTIYVPAEKIYKNPYVVLYMHGNSSCRVQALGLIRSLPQGIALASFDFMGCGKNQQFDTISLGFRQAEQAKSASDRLRNLGYRVILWGRSMGAATALLYGDSEFIVADSSFKSFKSLCKQVAKQHSPSVVPNCMINCFFPCVFSKIKKDVDKKANYDVEDLDVRQAVKRLNSETVVVFMSGNKDILINKRNSQKLYNVCPCKQKHLKIFEGDHNSKRPDAILKQVMDLIQNHVKQRQYSKGISPQSLFIELKV